MLSVRRLAAFSLELVLTAALVAIPATRAEAAPPPAGYTAGTGDLEGTESFQDEEILPGFPCFKTTRSVYSVRGAGTFEGVTATGQPVVYTATLASGQYPYSDGPIHIDVENTAIYYHGPGGTYGDHVACSGTTAEVPGEFRIWATDHIYRLDGGGAQVPCVGHGTFARGVGTVQWQAQWTLDADCTVVGSDGVTPVTGLARAGTGFTHGGYHAPCFDVCPNNIIFDYTQYLPFVGQHVGVTGPASVKVNTQAAVVANLTDDGLAVAGAPITFSVAGPGGTTPSGATVATGADGRASFSFTTATVGAYVVTASTPSATPGETVSGTLSVQFIPPPPPTVVLSGTTTGQSDEATPVLATFTDDEVAVAGVAVNFSATGPGVVTPASATVATNSAGEATFSFSGDRAGDYTVTASATHNGHDTSDTHTVALVIKTFYRDAALTLPSAEKPQKPALIDPAGDYAYFGSNSGVSKVDLDTFQRVGAITFPAGESAVGPAVIDPAGDYAYFANPVGSVSGPEYKGITKVDLRTFQRVGVLMLPADQLNLSFAAIDPAGHYLYTGSHNTGGWPVEGTIIKVNLDTFEWADIMALGPDDQYVTSAVISPAGDFAYLGTRGAGSGPSHVVKVNLTTFTKVGSVGMASTGEHSLPAAVIDPAGRFAYFSTQPAGGLQPNPNDANLVKIDLTSLQRLAGLTLDPGDPSLGLAVIDQAGNYAYFGASSASSNDSMARLTRLSKIDLKTFTRTHALQFDPGENGVKSAVIAPDGSHAYFGSNTAGKVVKVALTRPPNPALVAANDAYSTPYVTPLSVAAPGVLANDVDTGDGDPLSASQASDPPGGSVLLNANGSFTYTPDIGFTGTDTFTYTADDAKDYSPPATVSVTVGAPPEGVSSVGGGACGYYTNVGLFGGPQELRGCGQTANIPEGTSPSVSLAPAGSTGAITATKPGGAMALYGPAAIFSGQWPAEAAVPSNSGPLSVSTQGSTGVGGSATSSAAVVLFDTPVPLRCYGDPPGTTDCSGPGGIGPGPVTADEAHSTCTADESGLSASATFVNGIFDSKHDVSTQLPIVSEPIPDNPPPNYTRSGTLDHVGDSYRVVFNEQILGPDSITVNAVHMYLLGPTAIGDVVVGQSRCVASLAAPNAAPVAADNSYTASAGHPLVVGGAGVLGNDADADFGPLRASKLQAIAPPASGGGAWTFPSDPANGTLDLDAGGSFLYTSDPGFTGTDTFTYLAQDARGRSDPATVTINVVNAPNNAPVAGDDTYNTSEDTPLTVAAPGVVANDTDADTDPVTAGSPSIPAHGTVTLGADGSFTYTPTANYHGPDSFTYTASDGFGGSDTATVNLTVGAVNDAPVAIDDTAATGSGTPVTVAAPGVLANDTDVDGNPLTAGSATTPAHGTVVLNANGSFTYTPTAGYTGPDAFTYRSSDGTATSSPATVSITVSAATGALVSVGSVSVAEGDAGTRAAIFTVSLSAPSTSTVTVNYATANASAAAPGDYTAKTGSVSFAPGATNAKIKVPVVGDTAVEAHETYTVVLSGASGATIVNGTGTGTVVNDDASTTRRLAIGDVSVHEGDGGIRKAVFTVSLSKASTTAVKVNFATANGTAAKPGDYTTLSGTLSFAAGVTSMTVAVTVNPDNLTEANETFTVNLSTPTGAVISDASGLGTIVNDD